MSCFDTSQRWKNLSNVFFFVFFNMLRTRTAGILNPAGPEMGSSGSRYSSSQFSLVFLTTNQNRIFHYKPSSYWGIMWIILIFVNLVTLPQPWIILPWIPWIPALSHPPGHPKDRGPGVQPRAPAFAAECTSPTWRNGVFPWVFPMKKAMIPWRL